MQGTQKKSLRRGAALLLGALLVSAGGYALLRPHPTDRELIEELVQRAKCSLEARSVGEMMKCVAQDYHDEAGLSRGDLLRIARIVARNVQRATVTINGSEIAVDGHSAIGRFDVNVVFYDGGQVIPWPMRLEVRFGEQSQGWRGLWQKAWVVKSIKGHGVAKGYEELL